MPKVNNNRAVIVPASAGSGKTYRIAHEYIYDVLRDRYDESGNAYFDRSFYKRILAVTFTNKATEEMKSRILEEIHILASGKESDHLADLMRETSLDEATLRRRAKIVRSLILHDYSHFTVLTNDTFFQRILRAFIRELGIDMSFSTELDTAPILTKSVDSLIDSITENAELRKWLEELTSERISDGERWDIRSAISSLAGELFKESTRDIIDKCKDKESLSKSIRTFSTVVNEQRKAFMAKGALAVEKIISQGYTHDDFKLKFTKIFEKVATGTLEKFTDANLKHLTDSPKEWFNKGKDTPELLALAEELQRLFVEIYNDYLNLKTVENTQRILSRNFRGFALLHDLQAKVEDICREDNSMLLSETKHAIAGFISESEAPFIYEKVGNYFDKFMIDEFQDTSSKEWKNFLPLLRNAMAQSTDTSVLIVGDVKQSIYRWRGGDWRILGGEIEQNLAESKRVPLKNNWRSLPNIVEFNNSLFTDVIKRENERLNNLLGEADKAQRISEECKTELYGTLERAYSEHEQTPRRKHTNSGQISLVAPTEGEDELTGESGMPLYIERIREVLERGFQPRDITILVRKNSEGMEIAEELLYYRSQFPEELWFEITTEEALSLASSPAVKLIIAVMRLAINRNDTTSLVLYNHLHNNDQFGTPISTEDNLFFDSIRTMSPEDAFEHIVIRYADDLEDQTAYVLALHEHIVRFSSGKAADLSLFERWWREKGASLSVRVEKSKRAIEILTIHKAKGLENKVVIMPRCSWALEPIDSTGYISNIVWSKPAKNDHIGDIGFFPVSFNRSVGDSLFADGYFREMVYTCVDALNMLYVATTRAKEQLHLFIPNKKRGNTIASLLLDIYSDKMQISENGKFRHYEIGTFDKPEPDTKSEKQNTTVLIKEHSAAPLILKLKTAASRYFSDEEEAKLTPRSMGIRLHKAFEGATTREEIFERLNEMVVNGELNSNDTEELKSKISETLDNSIAGEWFNDSWEQLYRERSIIGSKLKTLKRPDRVMTQERMAVVVDYKFGHEKGEHRQQISEYMDVLREMGYSAKGYVWYVPTGKIVEIEA